MILGLLFVCSGRKEAAARGVRSILAAYLLVLFTEMTLGRGVMYEGAGWSSSGTEPISTTIDSHRCTEEQVCTTMKAATSDTPPIASTGLGLGLVHATARTFYQNTNPAPSRGFAAPVTHLLV